jgi:CheY-like chemotaxis protein
VVAQTAHPRGSTATETRAAITGQRALVADDEAPVRALLQRLLTRRGFLVDQAVDGRMASQLLERNQYDVILCDVQMPNMGGLALFDSIRRHRPDFVDRFVFISGDILNPELYALTDSSNIPLLSKPFGAAKLDDALDRILTRRFGRRHLGAVT